MKIRTNLSILASIAALCFLVSCAVPGVEQLTRPMAEGPVLGKLLNPTQITPETKAYLQEQGLYATYRKDPFEAAEILRERVGNHPRPAQRLPLIEICSDMGDRIGADDPEKAVGFHLAAADLAFDGTTGSFGTPAEREELVAAYNHSAGQVARILFKSGHDWGATAVFPGPRYTYRLRCRTGGDGDGLVDPGFFDTLQSADYLKLKGVEVERNRREGLGAAMVGHRQGTDERCAANPFFPPVGMALPVNAMLDFSHGGGEVKTELAFYDLMIRDETRLAGRMVPLAADLTAPLIVLYNDKMDHNAGWTGMLHPDEYLDKMGLYQLEPFRSDQIPVIFVHGLMSSPGTWLSVINQLRTDPVLRERYQLLLFRYPTGFPIPYNASTFRRRLKEFQAHFDPGRSNPNMRRILLIGHSMGGILSNAQIRSSEDTYTKRFFTRPIDDLQGISGKQRKALKELLLYEANPDVTRAVFIASPHRGSNLGKGPIGALGSSLVKFSMELVTGERFAVIDGMTELGRHTVTHRPTSVSELAPEAPQLMALLEQPVRPGVTVHSIIGKHKVNEPLAESGDTVVPYWSSHLDEVASEKVIPGVTHTSILKDADAIEEVRRILYRHAGLPYAAP